MRLKGIGAAVLTVAVAITVAPAFAQRGGGSTRTPMGNLGSPLPEGERGSSVSGPTLGYVVDASTGNLHMVNGIAGSSTMGAPVHRGAPIVVAAVAPRADYAVIVDESGDFWFYGQAGQAGIRGRSAGVKLASNSGVSLLATSPSGDGFVSFAAGDASLTIYKLEDGIPQVARSFSAGALNGTVSRLALPDGLGDPVAIVRDGSGTSIVRISDSGLRNLAALPDAVEISLFRGSSKAVILDRGQNALYETDLAADNPTLRMVASSAHGISEPVGMALSDDNNVVAVANAANRKALVVDLATSNALEVELPEAPSGVRRLNSRSVFQLTDASNGPMLLLDVQEGSARTVYVPVYQSTRGVAGSRATLR